MNDAGGGTVFGNMVIETGASLDASAASELSVGFSTPSGGAGADAQGSLTLGANTSLTLGAGGAPAVLNVGVAQRFSPNNSSTATGLLDASEGTLDAQLSELNVGTAPATGTFLIGAGVAFAAETSNVGTVSGGEGTVDFGNRTFSVGVTGNFHTQSLNFEAGLITGETLAIDAATGIFNFLGGTLAVDEINGDLEQNGGTLDPSREVGSTVVNGNYAVNSAGAMRIEVNGTGNADHDLLSVNGMVDLNSDAGTGASLEMALGFAASIGDSFVFLQNDGADAVSGTFDNLGQGGHIEAEFGGDTYTFEIDYTAGDGNDISLELISIL